MDLKYFKWATPGRWHFYIATAFVSYPGVLWFITWGLLSTILVKENKASIMEAILNNA